MDIISLVSGDSVADLHITLVRDDTGLSFNAGGADINLRIRQKGGSAILSTINYENARGNISGGEVVFALGPFLETAAEGYYEGEIEITFADDTVQTVYQIITLRVRSGF